MDDDWDWDHDEIVDLDVTGDPQFGYQSPRRSFRTPPPERDWLAQAKRDRQQREARRDRQGQEEKARCQRESPPSRQIVAWPGMNYRPGIGPTGPVAQTAPVEPAPESKGPLPGQHGAYFEIRTVRRWWAPWRKRKVWQQISTWHVGQPPRVGDSAAI